MKYFSFFVLALFVLVTANTFAQSWSVVYPSTSTTPGSPTGAGAAGATAGTEINGGSTVTPTVITLTTGATYQTLTPTAWPASIGLPNNAGYYLEFPITAASGYSLAISGLSTSLQKVTSAGTNVTGQAYISIDGGTNWTSGGAVVSAGGSSATAMSASWSSSNSVASGTIKVRIYFYSTGSTKTNGLRVTPVTVNATTTLSVVAPTTQPSAVSFPSVGNNGFTFNWTNGNGSGRIVKLNSTNSFTAPSNNTSYTGNAAYTSGEQVVYSGTGSSVVITGLAPGTTYYYSMYEFNGSGSSTLYNLTSPTQGNQATTSPATPPSVQPTFSVFSNIGTTGLTANWSIGDGSGQVVYMNTANSFSAPSDGSTPTASAVWTNSGQQCIYNGNGTTVNVSALSAGTTYYFQAYEYNNGASTYYLITSPANTSQATTIVPVTQSSAVNFTPVATTSMTINWTSGSGAGRIVRVNSTNSFVPPVDGTSYTANSVYTSGERTVYNGTGSSVAITGLSQGTTYYVEIFEYNGTGTGVTYNTTSPATGNQTTTVNPPSTQPTFTTFTNIGTTSLTANWTAGNGAGRVVYICDANSFVDPSTGVSPSANTVYAGTGQQCVYNGTGTNTVSITGLTAGTTYYLQAYEYNGSGTTITYLTTSPRNTSTATVIVPVTQASSVNFTSVSGIGMTINWTSGSGSNRIVRINTTDSFTDPVNGTSYTANATYTSGEQTVYAGTGATVSVTGLTTTTAYYVRVYEFSGTGTGIVYNTVSPATGTQTTPEGSNTTDYFRSASTGNWATVSSWEGSHDNSVWFSATLAPTTAASAVTVRTGHTITVAANLSIDDLTVDAGGQITIPTGITLTVANGTAVPDMTINGTLQNTGTLTLTGTAVTNGTYIHNVTADAPAMTYSVSSTIQYNTMPTNRMASIPGNFVWNVAGGPTTFLPSAAATTTVGGSFTITQGTIRMNSTANSKGLAITGDLVINGGGLLMQGGTAGTETVTANNVTVNHGTLDMASANFGALLNVQGNLSLNNADGILTYSSATATSVSITLNGTSDQSISVASAVNFPKGIPITINKASGGVNLSSDLSLISSLTLTSGLLKLGNYNLTLGTAATISGTPSATNMIVTNGTGQLRKTVTANGSFVFPLGDATGTAEYSPVTLAYTASGYSSAYVAAKVINAKHGSNSASSDFLNRYWSLSSSGLTGGSYTVTGTYKTADVDGTEANLYTVKYDGSTWTQLTAVNSVAHTISSSGLSSLGDFTGAGTGLFSGTVTITLIPEGYYRSDVDPLPVSDVFTATLASATGPDYADVETVNVTIDANTYTGTATFATAATGSYYLYVKGIALMATWSASPISFVKGSNVDYDFTTGVDKAYAIPGFPFDPMILQGTKWTIYCGDVDQDELIGNVDLTMIDNDAFVTLEVHGATDLDGDALVGNVDLTICDNHAFWVVESQTPRKVGGMASKYLHKPVLTRKINEQK